jgi:C_GCAxxG_C_C family probable redox protein
VKPVERVVQLFGSGHNCSQAVLTVFGEAFGVDPATARRLGRPWGGGMSRQGLTCGALTGAVLVLGLAKDDTDEARARQQTYEAVNQLFRRFEERYGSTSCRDLLGADMSTGEGRRRIEEGKLTEAICPGLVQSAAEILADLISPVTDRGTLPTGPPPALDGSP